MGPCSFGKVADDRQGVQSQATTPSLALGATNKILAERVDELTTTLADVRAQAGEVKEAENMAEATDTADEIIEDINVVIGPKDDDEDSGEEGSGDESEEESAEKSNLERNSADQPLPQDERNTLIY